MLPLHRLLTCALLCTISSATFSQSEPDCSYNPDFDGDGAIGVTDLLGFLGFYGDENSSDTCNFGPDVDCDGICDAFDDCIGAIDECGVCGGEGAFFPVIDTIIPVMDSVFIDCLGGYHVYQAWADTTYNHVCPTFGCTDSEAYNYDPDMLVDDGSCHYSSPGCNDGTLTVVFDGHSYDVVTIGEQCWFAENLRSSHYSNGDSILTGPYTTNESPRWYIPAQTPNYLSQKGRLYNWHAVNDERNICPNGWHVPSDLEWQELEMELGMSQNEANQFGNRGTFEGLFLKASPTNPVPWDGSNTTGLGLVQGGRMWVSGHVQPVLGLYWTSTPYNVGSAHSRRLTPFRTDIRRDRTDSSDKISGLSVRCVINP